MNELSEITQKIVSFRDDRNWEQFHTPKDLAICLNVESSELLELFLWNNDDVISIEKAKEELADVFYSAFLIAHHYKFDIKEIIFEKLKKNEQKYPIEKSKNSNLKYDML